MEIYDWFSLRINRAELLNLAFVIKRCAQASGRLRKGIMGQNEYLVQKILIMWRSMYLFDPDNLAKHIYIFGFR